MFTVDLPVVLIWLQTTTGKSFVEHSLAATRAARTCIHYCVNGDAHCLYQALAHVLTKDKENHGQITATIYAWKQANAHRYAPIPFPDICEYQEEMEEMKLPSAWGGEHQLAEAAHGHQVIIMVLHVRQVHCIIPKRFLPNQVGNHQGLLC